MDDTSAIDTVIDLDVITPVGQAKVDIVSPPVSTTSPPVVMLPIEPAPPIVPPIQATPLPSANSPSSPVLPKAQTPVTNLPKAPVLVNPLFENPDSVGLVKR